MSDPTPPARPAPDEFEFDIRTYLRILADYKWLVIAMTVAGTAVAAAWTARQPRIYQATCSIEYDPSPPRPLGSTVEDVADPSSNFWASREFLETQNRILASRGVAERVVRRLGLNADPTFFAHSADDSTFRPRAIEATAQRLQLKVSVEPIRETRIVNINVQDENPARAATIANALTDTFIEKTMEDRLGSTVNALEWLGEQLDDIRTGLNEAEDALHHFKEEHNILSLSMEDRRNIVANELESFTGALTEAQRRRIELEARVDRLRAANRQDALDVNIQSISENERMDMLRTALREKIAERDELAVRYGEAHPDIVAADGTIESLRSRLRQQVDELIDDAEADLREVRAIEAGLQSSLARTQQTGLDLNQRAIEYERLNRERENKAKMYELVLARATETDLTRLLRTTHVRLVDRALTPTMAISPNVTSNLIGGFFGGLALGIALAFGLSRLDRRIKSVQEVEGLGLTVLGILPTIASDEGDKGPKYGRYGRRSGKRKPAVPVEHPDLIIHTHPSSAVAECCRTIRTNLAFMSPEDPIRSIVVSSPHPREGKTTIACSLAISIAQSSKRVLLIDTDLRRPRVHKAFGLTSTKGVTSVLIGSSTLESAIQRTPIPGLDVLVCGPVPPSPSELLHIRAFQDLLSDALRKYDQVILDSPPLTAVTDAAIVAPQVDGAILVIKAGQTTRDAIRSSLRQLRDVGATILGGIVNDIDLDSHSYGGGYYHYYRPDGAYYSGTDGDHTGRASGANHAAE